MRRLSKRVTAQGVVRPSEPIGPEEPTVSSPWTSYPEGDAGYINAPQPGATSTGQPGSSMSPFDPFSLNFLPCRLNREDRLFEQLKDIASRSSKEDLLKAFEVYKRANPFIAAKFWKTLARRLLPLAGTDLEKEATKDATCPQCGLSFSVDELRSGGQYLPRGGLCPICRMSYGG